MKRAMFAGLSLGFILSGCATEEYVLQKTAPLADRLGMLENRLLVVDGKVNQLYGRQSLSLDERKTLDDVRDMSQKALDDIGRLAAELKKMVTDVSRAEAAAKRAEAAAEKAGQAEKRSK
jgi:esterase/lipase